MFVVQLIEFKMNSSFFSTCLDATACIMLLKKSASNAWSLTDYKSRVAVFSSVDKLAINFITFVSASSKLPELKSSYLDDLFLPVSGCWKD